MGPETYKAIYQAYHDAVIISDSSGIIEMVNSKAEQMFGYMPGELLGQSVKALVPGSFHKIHSGSTNDNDTRSKEKELHAGRVIMAFRKDKSSFYVETSISPISIDGRGLFVAFVKDVSVREGLHLRFNKMIGDIQDYSIVFLDKTGKITNWNKGVERIMGYKEEEVINQNFRIFYPEQDQLSNLPSKILAEVRKKGRVEEEGWRTRKDGSLFWASVVITSVKDDLGHRIGFSKITRDLTERKRAEELLKKHSEALVAKNKELENFTYIASHDLQEPLSTITGMIDLIKCESEDKFNEADLSYFTFIEGAIDRMRALIKDLLDYSRLGRDKELARLRVSDIIKAVQDDLGSRIQSENAEIIIGPMPEIVAYSVEFRLLFQNIIGNALKFVKQGRRPVIRIEAKEFSSYWRFSVEDNGIGIQKKFLEKVFVIFQRLNRRGLFEGSGIGLAHCKKIVEIHDGSIWVDSVVDKGSIFYFTISKNLKDSCKVQAFT
jgi:PAS domain S-box-containing protein